MINNKNNFKFNKKRLTEVCLRAYSLHGKNLETFQSKILPQWNLPEELEFKIPKKKVKSPKKAAQYLWLIALLERRSLSKMNIINGKATWKNAETRWIFNPQKVATKNPSEVHYILKNNLQYTLNNFAINYQENIKKLLKEYQGDLRNVIKGKTVEQAKKELMKFKGIGTGIANLLMIYLQDRQIVSPTNPEELHIKIDIHKARIPINTGAIIPEQYRLRRDSLIKLLEKEYSEVCKQHSLNPCRLDSTFFIIGSEICAKRDYDICYRYCPLEKLCISLSPEDRKTTEFVIYKTDIYGKRERIDVRKNKKQTYFSFYKNS